MRPTAEGRWERPGESCDTPRPQALLPRLFPAHSGSWEAWLCAGSQWESAVGGAEGVPQR